MLLEKCIMGYYSILLWPVPKINSLNSYIKVSDNLFWEVMWRDQCGDLYVDIGAWRPSQRFQVTVNPLLSPPSQISPLLLISPPPLFRGRKFISPPLYWSSYGSIFFLFLMKIDMVHACISRGGGGTLALDLSDNPKHVTPLLSWHFFRAQFLHPWLRQIVF